jgi:hypothetical protein
VSMQPEVAGRNRTGGHVLLCVEDQAMVARLAEALSVRPGLDVEYLVSESDLFVRVAQRRPSLLVLDDAPAGVATRWLERIHRISPSLFTMVLSSPTTVQAVSPWVAYLPRDTGVPHLAERLDLALDPEARDLIPLAEGSLPEKQFFDVLALGGGLGRGCRVELTAPSGSQGIVWLRRGEVVAASFADARGMEAIHTLSALGDAKFRILGDDSLITETMTALPRELQLLSQGWRSEKGKRLSTGRYLAPAREAAGRYSVTSATSATSATSVASITARPPPPDVDAARGDGLQVPEVKPEVTPEVTLEVTSDAVDVERPRRESSGLRAVGSVVAANTGESSSTQRRRGARAQAPSEAETGVPWGGVEQAAQLAAGGMVREAVLVNEDGELVGWVEAVGDGLLEGTLLAGALDVVAARLELGAYQEGQIELGDEAMQVLRGAGLVCGFRTSATATASAAGTEVRRALEGNR